jgi:HK97 family phage portal protein
MDRVLGRQPAALSLENPAFPLSSGSVLQALNIPASASTVAVNEKSALGMPAVWRAVNLIASGAASLPLHAYKQTEDAPGEVVRTRVTSGAAADLLAAPHPDLTPFELWEIVYSHIALWGNAYLQKLRNPAGQIMELWPIHPSRIKPGRATDGTKVYQFKTGDYDEPLTDRQVLHIPGFGFDGVCGLSPIQAHRQGIGLAMAAEEFGAKLFASGSLASGLLQTEQRLTPEQADALKLRWREKNSGLSNAHDVAVLDSGAKFSQLTIPPEDAQFLQSRSFQVEEVARLYGVPPHMLMSTEKATSWGTGIEQMTIGYVVFSLRPSWLTRVEQRVSSVLSPKGVYARYSLEGLLRGDSAARATFYTQMWNVGAFSTNDIRGLEELPPVEGGDVRYRPLNFGLLGESAPQEVGQTDA